MNRFNLSLALGVVLAPLAPSGALAQKEKPPTPVVLVQSPSGWILDVNADGSGHLQYGSSGEDGWNFRAGTFDAEKVTKDLGALNSDKTGARGSHFVFHFESERKGREEGPPARYTRDTKVIPALFRKAIEASDGRNSDRKKLLLKEAPPGLLPKN
jgi:hypothetical protein